MKNNTELTCNKISKKYTGRRLFKDISLKLVNGNSISVTGENGSGKTTFLKVISGLIQPSSGDVQLLRNNNPVNITNFNDYIGFTGPAVNPYPILNAMENIKFSMKNFSEEKSLNLLEKFNLIEHKNKPVKLFSSGMVQRLRIIIAMINSPDILILDEPGTNLDSKGKDILYSILHDFKNNGILVIATNDIEEKKICSENLELA